jgi:flagella basal body P-ring formation protein FlgA
MTRTATLEPIEKFASLLPLALAILVCLGLARLAQGEELALPPPPSAAPPAVDVALLRPIISNTPAEEIWSGTPTEPPLAEPPMAPQGDPQVQEMLDVVSRESSRTSTLESQLFEQLRAAMPEGSEGFIFEKTMIPESAAPLSLDGKVRYDFRLPARGIGTATFTATVNGPDGKMLRRFSGSVTIDREAQGIQVTRVIRRGEPLGGGDIKLLGTRLSQLPRGAFDRVDRMEGTVAREELRPGQWLTEQMVQVPDVVKRGQSVKVRLVRGAIQIAAPGITRQGGALGEVVRVENMQSRREVFARVISKDEVQVLF